MRLQISFFLCFLFSFANCFAKITLESLPHHGDTSVIHAIESAQKNIQITLYGFTDKKIAAALIKKQSQGVSVQLLIESEPYKASEENFKIIQQLKRGNIVIHYNSPRFALTHQKTILIDKKQAMILTGNFTYSGFYHQRNFIVTTDDSEIIKNLSDLFEADWNHATYTLSKNTSFILSPDNSWSTLNTLIKNTQNKLDIYALELTDQRIIHALLSQKTKIRIIISRATKLINKQQLCEHAIEIHRLKNLDQHAKALVSDDNIAYVGSANLTYSSLSKNREVGILFSDKAALKKLSATFEHDWKNSTAIC